MISSNEVFTKVREALKTEFGASTYVVGERVASPSKYPCVWVVEMDTYPTRNAMTLDASDIQRMSVFEVQAYSNLTSGASTQAKELVECATEAFASMGYRCMTSTPVDNAGDTSIKRHAARYRRVIGGGDSLT